MAEESFLGLGAARASSSSSSSAPSWKKITCTPNSETKGRVVLEPSSSSTASTTDENSSTNSRKPTNAADELVARYMKQCMDYHNEKVRLERIKREQKGQEQQVHKNQQPNIIEYVTSSFASNITPPPPPPTTTTISTQFPVEQESSNTTIPAADDLQTRIRNAKAIAQRLASTAPPPQPTLIMSSGMHPLTTTHDPSRTNGVDDTRATSSSTPTSTNIVYPYSQKRNQFLTTIHQKRLQASLLKNFNYLVDKDTELHERQLQTLQQTKDRSLGFKVRDDRVLSERRRKLQQQQHWQQGQQQQQQTPPPNNTRKRNQFGEIPKTVAGIGTVRKNGQRYNNLAVYVTGLPRGNSHRSGAPTTTNNNNSNEMEDERLKLELELEKVTLEKVLRQLFGSYGIISRVILYVDKKTGQRKGDGLVVYDYPRSSEDDTDGNREGDGTNGRDSFLEMVCAQVCVLPTFSILNLYPHPLLKKRKTLFVHTGYCNARIYAGG